MAGRHRAKSRIEFIRKQTDDHFHIEVAAYPEIHPDAKSYDSDIAFLKQKFDAGANSAITQYFYNADSYFYYRDACLKAGIDKPIYVGLMPITNFANLQRFSRNCGAEIPQWLVRKIDSLGDDKQAIAEAGQEIVIRLGEQLLKGGAPGIHFYTMNQLEPTQSIYKALL